MLLAGAAAWLVHLSPDRLRAPAWVAFTALGALGLAGACILARAMGRDGLARWLVCALLGTMTAIPGWIAFGSGPRQCGMSSFVGRLAAPELACRGAFAAGAAVLGILFVVAVRLAMRKRRPD